jgi:hypothetical protein
LLIVLLTSACSSQLVYPDLPQTGLARTPEVMRDSESGMASMTVSVLIYNVAGLPWPAGCGKKSRNLDDRGKRIPIACFRSGALKQIGDRLGEMRRRGSEPDIVMIQEAFISAAAEIPERGGYPNWVAGPGRDDLGEKYSERADEQPLALATTHYNARGASGVSDERASGCTSSPCALKRCSRNR